MPKKKPAVKRPPARPAAPKAPEEHTVERGIELFGEEVTKLGQRFEKKADEHGDRCGTWFRSTFGILGPFLSSVFGIVMLGILIWVMGFVNAFVGSGLISNLQLFLMANLGLLFLFSLFFSYSSYFSKCCQRAYKLFSPIFIAVGVAIGFWFGANVIRIVNLSLSNPGLTVAASALESATYPVMVIILIIGYLVVLAKIGEHMPCEAMKKSATVAKAAPKAKAARSGVVHRLYRSGNDRILGGVCGGIAEYLEIDPVIVRLLWILLALPYGFGIWTYIIMWIIMPRNPNHKWD